MAKPDFSGSWNLPYTPNMAKDIGELPFTAEGKAAYGKINTAFDPTGVLSVSGRAAHQQFAVSHVRVVQTSDSIVFCTNI